MQPPTLEESFKGCCKLLKETEDKLALAEEKLITLEKENDVLRDRLKSLYESR
jgi:hypothetical protein